MEDTQTYKLQDIIGYGTFSTVYKSINKITNEKVAIKIILSTSNPTRTIFELQCLLKLKGKNHIIQLIDCYRIKGSICIVMPYVPHRLFKEYYATLTTNEIQFYFINLFSSLKEIHGLHIIHRDIKPNNILFNKDTLQFVIIDFGLAQLSKYEKERKQKQLHTINDKSHKKPSREGTRGFRAPEVLLKIPYQSTAIDIWSAGVILLCILSGRFPFFYSPDDLTALCEISGIMGSNEISELGKLFNRNIEFPQSYPKLNLKNMCTQLHSRGINHIPNEAFDLLDKCLELNPNIRITAEEALNHPFLCTNYT